MKPILKALATIAILATTSAFANEPWDKTDKTLFAGFTALRTIDMLQTVNIARNPDKYYETNTLLGEHPSQGKVIGFFVATQAIAWLAADYMSPKARKLFLTGGIVVSAGFVGHNAKIGLGVRF
jgi:hypothetical protein